MVVPGYQRFEFSLLWSRKATWMAELSGSDRTCGVECCVFGWRSDGLK